ncbi:MAG: LemA family protein [Proteobacteria bacterium]|nr:LemA family protein [Pseudomonadota bacterium]MCH9758409.1 LemA family protein [Pseudomonadota bacterium]
MEISYLLILIPVVIIIYTIMVYNKLVEFRNRAQNGFSQIDVQLKRRYDLIPNLVESAKGYLKHERETLEAVISARNSAAEMLSKLSGNLSDVTAASALSVAEGALGSAMGNLQIAVEAYPDLKASANMMQLNEELTTTENKIAFSRQAYNDSINQYNTYRQSFPPIIFAGMFGHGSDMAFLSFAEGEKLQQAPEVSF